MKARAKIRILERLNQRLQEEVDHLNAIAGQANISVSEEDWEQTPSAVHRLILQMASEQKRLREQSQEQARKIEELQEQLRTNSRNSSKPPSSDPPSCFDNGRDGKHKPKGRSPGGQPGHEGKTRKLFRPDQVDQVIDCAPPEMCECGGSVRLMDVEPERRQTLDIPPIKPVVTEYCLFAGLCEACGRRYRGALPDGVGSGLLCPRPMAIAALLSGKYHLSKRNVVEILEDLLGTEICLGTVSNLEARMSGAIEQAVEEAKRFVARQSVVHMDETGWKQGRNKQGRNKAWLWTAVTSSVVVFAVRFSRGAKVAREMLGELFRGILVSDRCPAYNWLEPARRQLCWAHLMRDFFKISERSGEAGKIGTQLLEQAHKMFGLWHRMRDGPLDRRAFQVSVQPIREVIEALLEQGTVCEHAKTKRTCKMIFKRKAALWSFANVPGVEPTNNAAERAVRPAVLWRKQSFGTQSERGSEFVERMLTVCGTCKLQGRNVLDYLTQAIEASLLGQSAPSLLPSEATRKVSAA